MKLCRIEMLGGLRVVLGDHVITRFRSHKAGAILSHLALYLHRSHSREQLIELFWPDMMPLAARDNLSTALSLLRRQLEAARVPADTILLSDYQNVRINAECVETDVEEFERLLKEAAHTETSAGRAAVLERAVELYRGELLPGCYEEWAIREQARLKIRYCDALQRWMGDLVQVGDLEAGLATAQRALGADPYREETYQAQMWLCAALGRPALALEAYQELERFFRTELNASPSPASRTLAARLRSDPGSFANRRTTEWSAEQSAGWLTSVEAGLEEKAGPQEPPLPTLSRPRAVPMHQHIPSLPMQFTLLFGREEEMAQLRELLLPQDAPSGATGAPHARARRLITLTGPGGAGKTRLAIEVAEQVVKAFSGRVWFTPLAEVPDAALFPFALVNALKLPASSSDPMEQVVGMLEEAPCLLVLDNFEHLLRDTKTTSKRDHPASGGSTAFVQQLLERAPDFALPDNFAAAFEFKWRTRVSDFAPYPSPSEPLTLEQLVTIDSIALYADRARAVKPDFAVTAQNAEDVAELCRKLEGMPLAIEMTAAWARTLPPARILERLNHQLDLLVSRRRDLPPRHQSLRATIEWSYNLLPPPLRQAFNSLSVFRGGWSLKAAETVLDWQAIPPYDLHYDPPSQMQDRQSMSALEALAQLQEQSLLIAEEQEEEVRYRLLEPLREFAMEKLIEDGLYETMFTRHANYFLQFAEKNHLHGFGPGRPTAYRRLTAEDDNVLAALTWYEAHGLSSDKTEAEENRENGEKAFRLANAMTFFWVTRGYWQERRVWLEGLSSKIVSRTEARARTLIGAGRLAHNEENYERAQARCQEALAIMQETGSRLGAAEARLELGIIAMEKGDYPAAQALYEESLSVFSVHGERRHLAELLYYYGILAYKQGLLSVARERWENCYALEQEMGVRGGGALWILGRLLTETGDYAEARRVWRQHLLDRCLIGPASSGFVMSLEEHAMLAVAQGQWERAGRLWGAAAAVRKRLGKRLSHGPADIREYEERTVRLQTALGAKGYEAAFAAGSALTREQVIVYALEDLPA